VACSADRWLRASLPCVPARRGAGIVDVFPSLCISEQRGARTSHQYIVDLIARSLSRAHFRRAEPFYTFSVHLATVPQGVVSRAANYVR